MNRRHAIGILAAVCVVAAPTLLPDAAHAQDAKVAKAMQLLLIETGKLGPARLEGTDTVAGRTVPGLYFGATKMNNNFAVVDAVKTAAGGTATLFVRDGQDFVRVSTNVPNPDGGGRAIGTILDPKGPAIAKIRTGEAYYGDAFILGVPYVAGYEPIRDAAKTVIGIYYVGFEK